MNAPLLSYSLEAGSVVEKERVEVPRTWFVVERKEKIRMRDGKDQVWGFYVCAVESAGEVEGVKYFKEVERK